MESCPHPSISSGGFGKRLGSGIALLLLAAVGAALPTVSASGADRALEWSPELADALQTYRAGDYASARALAERVLAHTQDPQIRLDAAALRAMTWLAGPSRADRQMGIGDISQLFREHPELAERPECNLALGAARSALAETGAALELLDAAAEGFAARGENDRLVAALVALADTWSRHNEWEITPARFGISKPKDTAQARKVRREQIARLRERVAALPDSTAGLAQIDLLIAQDLLQDADTAPAGQQLLEQLAAATELTPPVVAATTALAERYEAERRWRDASKLYERLTRDGDQVVSQQASQKLAAITSPQLRLAVPAASPSGRAVTLDVAARNVTAVQVEVRRLDLQSWLTARQGRLSEAHLPVAGSLQFSRQINTPVAQPHDWWESASAGPLEFEAPPGAYVVCVETADQSHLEPLKRLLIVSDLAAVAWVGSEQAVIWGGKNPLSTTAPEGLATLTGDFWMAGSFVPTQPQFTAGVAPMDLPPEARVLRDRRWVCLLRAGEHLALCRGELPQDSGGPKVAFTGGPAEPRPGDILTLAGLVLDHGVKGQSTPAEWQLEIRNTLDEALATLPLKPTAAGMFSVDLPVPESWSGEHLRFVVRRDQRVAENLAPHLLIGVAQAGREEFVICPANSPTWPCDAKSLTASINAWLPWGAPASLTQLSSVLRVVRLPDETNDFQPIASDALRIPGWHGHLPVTTRGPAGFELPLPLDLLDMPPGPTAGGLWVTFSAWNGQQTKTLTEFLCAAEPVHAWIQTDPAEPVAGQPVQVRLGWFDPTRRTGLTLASATVHGAEQPPRELQFSAARGCQSAMWQPPQPGDYDIEVLIPRLDEPPVAVHRRVSVRHASVTSPQPLNADTQPAYETGFQTASATAGTKANVRLTAEYTGRDHAGAIQVRLEGKLEQPFVVLLTGQEPVAAQAFDSLDGIRECSFAPTPNADGLRAQLVSLSASGPETIAETEVAADPSRALQIDLTPGERLLPGQRIALPFEVRSAAGRHDDPPAASNTASASLLALLTPALWSGPVEWAPGSPSVDSNTSTGSGAPMAASWGSAATEQRPATPQRPNVPPPLAVGGTLWATSRAATDKTLELTLPQTPGVYRLAALARDEQGTLASKDILLDTRAGLRLLPDVPARCTLGDRFVIGMAVQNPHAVPVTVNLTVDPGAGLSIESLRVIDPPENSNVAPVEPLAREVVLPASGVAWLQARVEAVQSGQSDLKMSTVVRAVQPQAGVPDSASNGPVRPQPGDAQDISVPYAVSADGQSDNAGRPLRISRTLLLLEKDDEPPDAESEDLGPRRTSPSRWHRYVLPPGARLKPGQRILVRESFELAQPATAMKWSQRIPPNCSLVAQPQSEPRALGLLEPRRADQLDFRARGITAGPHEHEYELVATRPGVCVLPMPEIWISGQRVDTAGEPEELRLHVLPAAE